MAKNLFDFGDEKVDDYKSNNTKFSDENLKNNKQGFNENQTKREAENLYEKYKKFSQSELIDEFSCGNSALDVDICISADFFVKVDFCYGRIVLDFDVKVALEV